MIVINIFYGLMQETFGTGSAAQSEAGKKGGAISGWCFCNYIDQYCYIMMVHIHE
jgi:hypothetical protein